MTFMKFFAFVLIITVHCTQAIDWWDILSTELSCCSTHSNSYDCSNEGANDCSFVDVTETCAAGKAGKECRFKQRLADEFGACLQESFISCKVADGKVNACCAPGCKGITPPAGPPPAGGPPANGVAPVCFPKVTPAPVTPSPVTPSPVTPSPTTPSPTGTEQPTSAPTSACQLGVNYNFEGRSCTLSGDPHTTMFNGNKHDFQGQPLTEYQNTGELLNQFYYIHPCNGVSDEDMPIKALVTHYHWGTRSVSGADYITLILTEFDGGNKKEYYVYLSSALHYYVDASNGGISTDYDIANGNGVNFNSLVPSQSESIGRRFKVLYTNIQSNYKSYFKITVDDSDVLTVYMQAQAYSSHSGRYAMHYIQMNVASELKCYTCGLCGDFMTVSSGATEEAMEGCHGEDVDYKAGWNPAYTPEAFDCAGWSWEKHFVDDESCPGTYDNTDVDCGLNTPTDPCPVDSAIYSTTVTKCEAAIDAESTCCDEIGNDFCEGLLSDCKVDVCAAANGDTGFDFDSAIQEIITNPIDAVCADPELNPVPPTETTLCDLTGQSIKASRDNQVCTIDIGDIMIIEMEIEIGVIDSAADTWESVFHIGNENMQRWPGLWVHPNADQEGDANDGFHISYGTTTHNNPYGPTSAAGGAHYDGDTIVYKSIQTQSRLTIIENGETIFDQDYDPHPTATNVAVYIGDPWYVAADITISNLVIRQLEQNTNDALLLYHELYGDDMEILTNNNNDNYNYNYSGIVLLLIILFAIGLYIKSKRKSSKEYMALTDNTSETDRLLINKQYSSCNQV